MLAILRTPSRAQPVPATPLPETAASNSHPMQHSSYRPRQGPCAAYRLYHGGKRPAADHTPLGHASRHIFGPGLYLTPHVRVAEAYVHRHQGHLFEVAVDGPAAGVLDLQRPLRECAALPRYIFDLLPPVPTLGGTWYDVMAGLHGDDADDDRCRRLNLQLRSLGVWLIIGHAGGMADSGFMDKGPQFVLLDMNRATAIQHINAA